VVKEAEALASAGHEVEVLGSGSNREYQKRDDKLAAGKQWKFTGLIAKQGSGEGWMQKAKRRLGNEAHRLFGRENRWQLGPVAEVLLKEGRKRNADLYIAHSEAGMWAAEKLRTEGRAVGVDMEDWFSEDLLPEARRYRPIQLLKTLERNLLCHGVYSSCTSEAMADALVKEYGCRKPVVLRNVFPLKDREGLDGKWKDRPGMAKWMERNDPSAERPKEAPVSIHWFSQTIGPGRGLEVLFQALEGLEGDWELHLRGNLKGYEGWLEKVCPAVVRQRLTVHGLVENEELLSRIAEHDIGYAGELQEPPSRDLTITNKLFQYLQAGLAVVASDTAGQREAAETAVGAVSLFSLDRSASLREALQQVFQYPKKLLHQRQQAWDAGNRLNWGMESRRLLANISTP
jgi:glycosyltransferase involved in cell wall biosynthesis